MGKRLFSVFVVGVFLLSFLGVYLATNPGLVQTVWSAVGDFGDDAGSATSSSTLARTTPSPSFSASDPDLRLNASMPTDNSGARLVRLATGEDSRYRKLARGVVRVDLKFRSTSDPNQYVQDNCTGFLVDRAYVVTARHCLVNDKNSTERLISARLVLDYLDDSSWSFVELRTDPDSIVVGSTGEKQNDFAIMQIAETEPGPDLATRALSLDFDASAKLDSLFVIHHPYGRPSHLSHSDCVSRAISSDGTFSHTCMTYPGSSGAPVFGDSSGKVVGIHISRDGRESQTAVSIEKISDLISAIKTPQLAQPPTSLDVVPAIVLDDSGAPVWNDSTEAADAPDGMALEDGFVVNEMSEFILSTVEELANSKRGLGYHGDYFFTEDLLYGENTIKGKNSPTTMCVAAITEVLIRALDRWSEVHESDQVFQQLPSTVWTRKTPKGLWPWLFHWNMERTIPAYNRSYGTGARDAFVLFGIGRSVTFEAAEPGDIVYFNRTNTRGHAAVFLGYLKKDYELAAEYDEDVVGFKYFSAQESGTPGLDYRAAYFTGYCPPKHGTELRKDCTVVRSDDPRLFSMGRLYPPSLWSTFDTSIHIDALFQGSTLEEIEAARYKTERSFRNMQRALNLNEEYANDLTIGPAFSFDGSTVED